MIKIILGLLFKIFKDRDMSIPHLNSTLFWDAVASFENRSLSAM